jgi:nitrogen fixation protein FixH
MMGAARRFLRFETFTGWHMLAVMVLFFGTIITVNLTMAYYASSSWSGLLVKNTYVASQKFDEQVAIEREMQQRGWLSDLSVDAGAITYRLADAAGSPVIADVVTVFFNRPVGTGQDRLVTLRHNGDGVYFAVQDLPNGQWVAKVRATRDGGLIYRESRRLHVSLPEPGQ